MSGRYLPGSCVSCGQGTDTGLIVVGEAEWHAAFLVILGIPEDQAGITVSEGMGYPIDKVPAGTFTATHRVCRECARRSNVPLPDPAVLHDGALVPAVQQPPDD